MHQTVAVAAKRAAIRAGVIGILASVLPDLVTQSFEAIPDLLDGFALIIISEELLGHDVTSWMRLSGTQPTTPFLPLIVTSPTAAALSWSAASPLGALSIDEDEVSLSLGVRRALAGRRHVPESLGELLASRFVRSSTLAAPTLTQRELQVMRAAATGATVAQIASTLFISASTTRTHIRHVYEKLAVGTRLAAIRRLEDLGLLEDPRAACSS